jgi:hypothetical protein
MLSTSQSQVGHALHTACFDGLVIDETSGRHASCILSNIELHNLVTQLRKCAPYTSSSSFRYAWTPCPRCLE